MNRIEKIMRELKPAKPSTIPKPEGQRCPFHHALRSDLPPLTARIAKLPVDPRGYPIPFFVAWVNGKAEFQLADQAKKHLCRMQKLCWVCGEKLAGEPKGFVIGPMCSINRVSAEPPSHLECCEWSVKGCPFLIKPHMVRRENEVVDKCSAGMPGLPIYRNPGAMAVWETNEWEWINDQNGRRELCKLGDAISVSWWREGRPATRAEVMESITTGLPLLRQACYCPEDHMRLGMMTGKAMALLPAE